MRHDSAHPLFVLVPGAWMGEWVWQRTLSLLHRGGIRATAITLVGLAQDVDANDRAVVGLADHVVQLCDFVHEQAESVVLVGHSYSGIVVGQVADRLPESVVRSVHISSFLPREGQSLIDEWGPDEQAREEEQAEIAANGGLWAPPQSAALAQETALTQQQRRWLASRFVPHPGRTVLDPATMSTPITAQAVTFISSVGPDADPERDLPPELADGAPQGWDLRTMNGGHWPMLSDPEGLARLLTDVVGV